MTSNVDILKKMYQIETDRLNTLIEQLKSEKALLENKLKMAQPKNRSTQIARLFMPKSQWK